MTSLRFAAAAAVVATLWQSGCSCSAGSGPGEGGSGGFSTSTSGGSTASGFNTGGGTSAGGGAPVDNCAENAKLVYVLSVSYQLYSFNPTVPGSAAYKLVGPLDCPAAGAPQSMAISRTGTAFVFYDSGELFQVSTEDAACTATPYVHPVQEGFNQLGMGFTATAPNSEQEQLYILSPAFGLAKVDVSTYGVTQLGALADSSELTGGPDARLFRYSSTLSDLSEIQVGSWGLKPIHVFNELAGTQAFAFSRYAGKFYMFTSPGSDVGTRTTEYDPVANVASVRDADVGFTIVGAGQSTCVPPPPPM